MSEFDKEAEREKLREKFARDEEKREHTQRMSELLLKGATMTNQHCNNCGDPIFRHDGDEFCPTCGGAAAEQAADVPEHDTEVETAEKSLDSAQAAHDGAPAGPETAETSADASTRPTPTPTPDPSSRRAPPSQQSSQSSGDAGRTSPSEAAPASPADGSAQRTGSGRVELQRALSTAAANAAAAEDPHTAKAWLEAAREAAEALSALDR